MKRTLPMEKSILPIIHSKIGFFALYADMKNTFSNALLSITDTEKRENPIYLYISSAKNGNENLEKKEIFSKFPFK